MNALFWYPDVAQRLVQTPWRCLHVLHEALCTTGKCPSFPLRLQTLPRFRHIRHDLSFFTLGMVVVVLSVWFPKHHGECGIRQTTLHTHSSPRWCNQHNCTNYRKWPPPWFSCKDGWRIPTSANLYSMNSHVNIGVKIRSLNVPAITMVWWHFKCYYCAISKNVPFIYNKIIVYSTV